MWGLGIILAGLNAALLKVSAKTPLLKDLQEYQGHRFNEYSLQYREGGDSMLQLHKKHFSKLLTYYMIGGWVLALVGEQ